MFATLLALFFSWSFIGAFRLYCEEAEYAYQIYSIPAQQTLNRVFSDLFGIRSWGPVYIDLGARVDIETYVALILSDRHSFPLIIGKPANDAIYRLEAYTHQNYKMQPDDDPINIWLPEDVGKPSPKCETDPFFTPEHWIIQRLTDCDTTAGWIPQEQYARDVFPYGQDYSFIKHSLDWNSESQEFHYQTQLLPEWENQPGPFVITVWLFCPRWEMIDRVSLQLEAFGKRFLWNTVEAAIVNTNYPWRRVLVRETEAQSVEKTGGDPLLFDFRLRVQTRPGKDILGSSLGIDEIRIAKHNL